MPRESYEIIPFGDSAFLVKFASKGYSDSVIDHIHSLITTLQSQPFWVEVVAGYDSLLACFRPAEVSPVRAEEVLEKALKSAVTSEIGSGKVIEIPVCYGGEYGPDIDIIIKNSGLTETEVIKVHSDPTYKVCMMGFVPGFTFLSEAPEILHHNRRATPRAVVPSGSVGIAGWQTGIYGLESPGGWQLIGRTPLSIFDSQRENPFFLKAGDSVKFVPISAKTFTETVND